MKATVQPSHATSLRIVTGCNEIMWAIKLAKRILGMHGVYTLFSLRCDTREIDDIVR